MKQDQLNEILMKHKMWLNREKEGERADLSKANLTGANLEGVNLSRAILHGANLIKANLAHANLAHANLSHANLIGANLIGANLSDAILDGADLWGTKNISSFQAGEYKRTCYAVKHNDCVMFKLGSFWGNTEEAVEAVIEKYGVDSSYEKLILIYTDIINKEVA